MSFKIKTKKNPTVLLAILLVAHMGVISLNRVQGLSARGDERYAQVWLMAALAPFQWATAKTVGTVSGLWHNYFSLRDSRLENDRLRAELAERGATLTRVSDELKLAGQARALSEWQAAQKAPTVAARVIARDADQWFNTVVIDRGTLAGVAKDHPVVTPEGLVGRVVDAAPNAARVLLMTDERHGAGAIIGQLAESRLLGVVEGRNHQLCEMKIVSTLEKVEPGETVITSGQDGIYPRGLIIGRVRRIEGGAEASPLAVEVEPAAPLAKLDLVAVLKVSKAQTRGPVDQLLDQEKERERQTKPARSRRR